MSEIIESRLIKFVESLTPDTNAYQATADYITNLLLPCNLPLWSRYAELVILAEFVIMILQSSYILYTRSKTKKIYHIGLNEMGLIQLDRANHCGLFYFLYATIAVLEITLEPFVRNDRVDQGWPDFILGIQFTLTNTCAGIIIWLAICHCSSVQGYTSRRSNSVLPTTAAWALNICLIVIIFVPTVTIIFSFYQVAMEYHRIRQIVMPVVHILRHKACSPGKCSVTDMIPQRLSLIRALPHIDLLVNYTRVGINSYLFFDVLIYAIYMPVLHRLFQSFKAQRRLFRASQRQQDRVFANTLIEFTIVFFNLGLAVYLRILIRESDFVFNPKFFLALRIGVNGVVSNLGNIALFLLICSNWQSDVEPPKVHIPILPASPATGFPKSDENTSPCYPYL